MKLYSLEILQVGSCRFPDFLFRKNGAFTMRHFPALVGLLHTSEGYILFDTGYSTHFKQACGKFPNCLYGLVTPIQLSKEQMLTSQLNERGIHEDEVSQIYLSHFHADHVAGLKDFPNATIVYPALALEAYQYLSKWEQVKQGFIAELLPEDFAERSLPKNAEPLMGGKVSEPVQLVGLAGHSPHHAGLLITTLDVEILLAGDAFWTQDELYGRENLTNLSKRIIDHAPTYLESQNLVKSWLNEGANRVVIASHESPSKTYFNLTV